MTTRAEILIAIKAKNEAVAAFKQARDSLKGVGTDAKATATAVKELNTQQVANGQSANTLAQATKMAATALKEEGTAAKGAVTDIQALAAQQRIVWGSAEKMTKEVREASEALEVEKREAQEAAAALKRLEGATNGGLLEQARLAKEAKEVAAALAKEEKEAKQAAKALKEMERQSREAARAQKELSALSKFNRANSNFQQSVGPLGGVAVTFAAVQALKSGYEAANEYDRALFRVKTQTQATDAEIKAFTDTVGQLSKDTLQSVGSLTEGFEQINRFGITGAEGLEVLKAAAKGSSVEMGDLGDLVRLTGGAMTVFGDELKNPIEALEILKQTDLAGALDLPELVSTLPVALSTAKEAGATFRDLAGAIAGISTTGIPASQAVVAVNTILRQINRESPIGAKALKEVGLSYADIRKSIEEDGLLEALKKLDEAFKGDNTKIAAVFQDAQAIQGFQVLTGGFESVEAAFNSVKNTVEGGIDSAFAERLQSDLGKAEAAANAFNNEMLKFGQTIRPYVTEAMKFLGDNIGLVSAALIGLGAIVVANVIGNFVILAATTIPLLIAAMGTLVSVGITGVLAGFSLILLHPLVAGIAAIVLSVGALLAIFTDLGDYLADGLVWAFNAVVDVIGTLLGWIGDAVVAVTDFLGITGGTTDDAIREVNGELAKTTSFARLATNAVNQLLDAQKNAPSLLGGLGVGGDGNPTGLGAEARKYGLDLGGKPEDPFGLPKAPKIAIPTLPSDLPTAPETAEVVKGLKDQLAIQKAIGGAVGAEAKTREQIKKLQLEGVQLSSQDIDTIRQTNLELEKLEKLNNPSSGGGAASNPYADRVKSLKDELGILKETEGLRGVDLQVVQEIGEYEAQNGKLTAAQRKEMEGLVRAREAYNAELDYRGYIGDLENEIELLQEIGDKRGVEADILRDINDLESNGIKLTEDRKNKIAELNRERERGRFDADFKQELKDLQFEADIANLVGDARKRAIDLYRLEQSAIEAGIDDASAYKDAWVAAEDAIAAARDANRNGLEEYAAAAKSNAQVVADQNAIVFEGVRDGIKEFVKTGKLDMESLFETINGRLADLFVDEAFNQFAAFLNPQNAPPGLGATNFGGGAGGAQSGGGFFDSILSAFTQGGQKAGSDIKGAFSAPDGGGGLLGQLGDLIMQLLSGLGDALSSLFGGGGGDAASIGGDSGGLFAQIGSLFGFANGGIMTNRGAAALRHGVTAYRKGGIANKPQMALFGEGSKPEAFVPLPDGRSIPVSMQGGGGQQSTTIINANYNIKTNDVQGFQASQPQILANTSRQLQRAAKRNN